MEIIGEAFSGYYYGNEIATIIGEYSGYCDIRSGLDYEMVPSPSRRIKKKGNMKYDQLMHDEHDYDSEEKECELVTRR